MHLQRITVPRVRETSPKAIGAGARTVDAGLGHPDLTQFANELAAAAPPQGTARMTIPVELNASCGPGAMARQGRTGRRTRRHPTRSHGSRWPVPDPAGQWSAFPGRVPPRGPLWRTP